MRKTSDTRIFILCLVGAWIFGIGGCTTSEIQPPPPPAVPDYVKVPHPEGVDLGDLSYLFTRKDAPPLASLKGCDADIVKLRKLSQSDDELRNGARALVKRDPVGYHWCFYGKLLTLENFLKSDAYVDQKQKETLDTYQSLVPIAQAFMAEFNDSRYFRWAVQRYRKTSELVFYRKLDLSPRTTVDLVEAANPFGLWRQPKPQVGILEKYGLGTKPILAAGTNAAAAPSDPAKPETVPVTVIRPDLPDATPPQGASLFPPGAGSPPAIEGPAPASVSPASPSPVPSNQTP